MNAWPGRGRKGGGKKRRVFTGGRAYLSLGRVNFHSSSMRRSRPTAAPAAQATVLADLMDCPATLGARATLQFVMALAAGLPALRAIPAPFVKAQNALQVHVSPRPPPRVDS
jgi:hypothetical protein